MEKRIAAVYVAFAEAIREAGEIPSGHLYAQVMGVVTLDQYNAIIAQLKKTELVTETGHLLKWVGP